MITEAYSQLIHEKEVELIMEKISLVLYFLGCLICLLNIYTSWCRYPVHKFILKKTVDDSSFISGIPLLGGLLIVVALSIHVENYFMLLLGAFLGVLDTGGIHWFVGVQILSSLKGNEISIKKEEIIEVLGIGDSYEENENLTALVIRISDERTDVLVTVPYDVTEIYYEAKNSDGTILVKDWHDHYGPSAYEDYIDTLRTISYAIKSPSFKMVNNGKTVELDGNGDVYFFGEVST